MLTSRALCQSVMQTSCSGSIVRTRLRSSVAKCPDSGATTSTRGWAIVHILLKRSSVPKGVTDTGSSVTATSRLPTRTLSMP